MFIASSTPSTTAGFFWGVIGILILTKLGKALREGTHSKKACWAMILTAVSVFLIAGLMAFIPREDRTTTIILFTVFSTFWVISSITILTLAILGLKEIKRTPGLMGRKPAWWAMVLVLFFTGTFVSGFLKGRSRALDSFQEPFNPGNITQSRRTPASGSYAFESEELNCRIHKLPSGFRPLNLSTLNPDVTVSYMHASTRSVINLIAEAEYSFANMSTAELAEIAKVNAEALLNNPVIHEPFSTTLAGLPALQFEYSFKAGGRTRYINNRLLSHNGFFYQLLVANTNPRKSRQMMEQIVKEFELIDPEKLAAAPDSMTKPEYVSKRFGFKLSPPLGWLPDDQLEANFPKVDAGGFSGNSGYMLSSFYYGDNKPDSEALIKAVFYNEDTEYPSDTIQKISESEKEGFTVFEFKSRQRIDNKPFENHHYVYVGKDHAVGLTLYVVSGMADLNKLVDTFSNRLTLGDPTSGLNPQNFTEQEKKRHALRLNQVAVYYHTRSDNASAIRWGERALKVTEDVNESLIKNMLQYQNATGEHEEAVQMYETWVDKVTNPSTELKAWHAWHLTESGQTENAKIVYETIFGDGHQDVYDFTTYFSLLLQAEETPEAALRELRKFDQGNLNRLLTLEASRILRSYGYTAEASAELGRIPTSEDGKQLPDQAVEMERAFVHADLGQYVEALDVYEKLKQANMADHNLYYHQARAYLNLNRYRQAKQTLEQALSLSPENEDIRELLTFVSGQLGEGENSTVRNPIEPVEMPELIVKELESLQTRPLPESYGQEAGGYNEFNVTAVKRVNETTLRTTVYRKINITDRSGLSTYSTLSVDFNPLYESIYVNRLHILDPEGKKIAEGDRNEYFVMDDPDQTLATTDKTLQIPVPKLAVGHTIEWVFSRETHTGENEIPFELYYLNGLSPIRLSALSFEVPTDSLRWKTFNSPEPLVTDTHHIWKLTDTEIYKWETRQPNVHDIIKGVAVGSAGKSWKEESKDYLDRIKKTFTLPDEITKLANQQTEAFDSPSEKIHALAVFVQQNCVYQGIEFGVRGQMPHEPGQTLSRKYGDCKDHAVLLRQLLKAVDIPSSLVLVNTSTPVYGDLPSLDQFDHMINVVKVDGKNRFIDTTDKYSDPLKETPFYYSETDVLILDDENPRLAKIPPLKPEENLIEVSSSLSVDAEEKRIILEETFSATGPFAAYFRASLETMTDFQRRQWLQMHVLPAHKRLTLQEMKIEHLDQNDQPFVIKTTCTGNAPKNGFTADSIWDDYFFQETPNPSRSTPFAQILPLQYRRTLTVEKTDGINIQALHNSSGENKMHTWNISTVHKDHQLKSVVDVTYNTFKAPPEEFTSFVNLREQLQVQAGTPLQFSEPETP